MEENLSPAFFDEIMEVSGNRLVRIGQYQEPEDIEDLGERAGILCYLERIQFELFQYNQYDWSKYTDKNHIPLKLSKGYFTFYHKRHRKKVERIRSWIANVQRHPETGRVIKVYAHAQITNKRTGKRRWVYLHRWIKNPGLCQKVDHKNGWGLDNRDENLKKGSQGSNISNSFCPNSRTVNHGLPPGVYPCRKDKKQFRGRISYRRRVRGKITRIHEQSKKTWDDPMKAHAWYVRRHKQIFGNGGFEAESDQISYPIFPPRKSNRNGHSNGHDHDIPF